MSPVDVQKALAGATYPSKGSDLARLAENNGADQDMVKKLKSHADDRYENPGEVQHDVFKE
ncbi:DUF2795 domain-containing protein [Streptomyces sp. NPDC059740]|uniref:DUF2795 domain-containing protein n=1 Tax=Streptomyces sp. NPDC059740 TaxID=3346926 RepID=UPI00364A7312